jgi:hypothetical protein
MKTSMVQKLTNRFGGSWVYIHARGFWICSTGRYALKLSSAVYVSREGRYSKEK